MKDELKSSVDSITVSWNKVSNTDGIPITGYHLYVDDGYEGDFV
jgi:hypothetical protein